MPVAVGQVLQVPPQPDQRPGEQTSEGEAEQRGVFSPAVLPLDCCQREQQRTGGGKNDGYDYECRAGGELAAVPAEPPLERDTLGVHGKLTPSCAVPPAVAAARGPFLLEAPFSEVTGNSR